MLESPGDKACVRAERSHAPGAAKHLDYEPAGYRGRVTPHATPVLFSTRVSSSVNELLEEGAQLTVVPHHHRTYRSEGSKAALDRAGAFSSGRAAEPGVQIRGLLDVLTVHFSSPDSHRTAPRCMPQVSVAV